jgi:2-succinyl-5-enolpyruvyl-6-hydroxy-3-cyclohexene-1-carboxylate synthase
MSVALPPSALPPSALPPSVLPPSVALAAALVDELVRCGVTEAVLAPGSRSAPLAFALVEADARGRLRLHVRIDERSAGFLALGLAKASGAPVAVVTTSGTATANLHPAVLEAGESGVALVVLTADRPPELRSTGASQTVDQVKLYGGAVRMFHEVGAPTGRPEENAYVRALTCRAVATAVGGLAGRPGPVHLNLALREPLVPEPAASPVAGPSGLLPAELAGRPGGGPWTSVSSAGSPEPPAADQWPARCLVVAGDGDPDQGAAAARLAESRGWPLIAEPSSGARTGPNALRVGHLLLGADGWVGQHLPQRVLVVGHPTLHRQVADLLRRPEVRVEVVASAGWWPDAGRSAAVVLPDVPVQGGHHPELDPGWLRAWQMADTTACAVVASVHAPADGPGGVAELSGTVVAADLLAALPAGSLLVAGSSMPVRDLAHAQPRDGVTVLANRGAAGIDGTVSTAIGAALAWQSGGGGLAFALMGDLTVLHDANGLILGPDEPRPDLSIVVVNNDGGAIFSLLEQGSAPFAAMYERVFGTPHGVDLAALCGATGTPHTRVSSTAELVSAATDPRGGLQVVEIRVGRAFDRARAARVRTGVAAALAAPRGD